MKKYSHLILILGFIYACSGISEKKENNEISKTAPETIQESTTQQSDIEKGIGKFSKVDLSPLLDQAMANNGKSVYELKCAACHKLSAEKLVGPGWKGVTERRKPEWIMNFSVNTDEMINKDPQAQAMLEECLVRMPNQNLNDADARAILEFMRKNDGLK